MTGKESRCLSFGGDSRDLVPIKFIPIREDSGTLNLADLSSNSEGVRHVEIERNFLQMLVTGVKPKALYIIGVLPSQNEENSIGDATLASEQTSMEIANGHVERVSEDNPGEEVDDLLVSEGSRVYNTFNEKNSGPGAMNKTLEGNSDHGFEQLGCSERNSENRGHVLKCSGADYIEEGSAHDLDSMDVDDEETLGVKSGNLLQCFCGKSFKHYRGHHLHSVTRHADVRETWNLYAMPRVPPTNETQKVWRSRIVNLSFEEVKQNYYLPLTTTGIEIPQEKLTPLKNKKSYPCFVSSCTKIFPASQKLKFHAAHKHQDERLTWELYGIRKYKPRKNRDLNKINMQNLDLDTIMKEYRMPYSKYSCDICEFFSSDEAAFARHMLRHRIRKTSSELHYLCLVNACKLQFKDERAMAYHVACNHKEYKIELPLSVGGVKKVAFHVCHTCRYAFVDEYLLHKHLKSHTPLNQRKKQSDIIAL